MMEVDKPSKLFWPETTVPYGEDTAFQAARVYAGAITGWQEIFEKKDELLRRAGELLRMVSDWQAPLLPDEVHEWVGERNQWLRDAGLEDK